MRLVFAILSFGVFSKVDISIEFVWFWFLDRGVFTSLVSVFDDEILICCYVQCVYRLQSPSH